MAGGPEHIKDWYDRDSKTYKKVYRNIKTYLKKNPEHYPMAQPLMPFYELAGQHSAHATFEWFSLRLKSSEGHPPTINYVETPQSIDDFYHWYYFLLGTFAFVVMLLDGSLSYYKQASILTDAERKQLQQFCSDCETKKNEAFERMKEQGLLGDDEDW